MNAISPEEREAAARGFFREGYNCCQSVLLAFVDIIALPKETLAGLSSGFGGGMGRLREVCGAMSAMTFISGVICPASNPTDTGRKTENYALVQKFAAAFKEQNGSIVCRELLKIRAAEKQSPKPEDRTQSYYASRPCESIVGTAARIIAEELAGR